ncbi:mitochondrial fission ELM1 family protein [Geoalkalibacter halelectricus]|uniref:Mitochondrial fission ELM1 family protein n=1 Tax=Geoalkalibacter halelectricus TaxID=2847045 RepID=A0ABY5ZHI8_9BACT|nr:mitochondrial fission ELM1 family protein [Geoalkalibacter halelectricus]MDO3379573.1 mitochondrial fission ELM1 family protein [Geoalkalibacter halelectricus]UWZ78161.1 mitochondrial fission ELM1 family protein [Geoalkalibacter halelectricus]
MLILSDGKPGHVNQALAYARLLGLAYEVRRISFSGRLGKALSYPLDRLGIWTDRLFSLDGRAPSCAQVVSAGSGTYYANRVIARELGALSVAIMLPRGYRLDFDLIIAQEHDRPPAAPNILSLPVNLSCPQPQGLVEPVGENPCVAFVIGGPSRHFRMDVERLRNQIEQAIKLFPHGDFIVTTSPRTPAAIDRMIESLPFRYRLLYSRDPKNPIADFLHIGDYVFVTQDSTSMISEAVTFGQACVEVLPLEGTGEKNKVGRMVDSLAGLGCLHLFDGTLGGKNRKIALKGVLEQALSRLKG